jgi:CBS domain-containing protein
MGDFTVRAIKNQEERNQFYHLMLQDIKALDQMILDRAFTTSPIHIGAEQEMCIIDKEQNPAPIAQEVLSSITDPHFTNELAKFNLEANLDPFPLSDSCFSKSEDQLIRLLKLGLKKVKDYDSNIILTGILPTLQLRHMDFAYMTPMRRYKVISDALFKLRGSEFEIQLSGVDELFASLNSVLFEACNTSFQMHLQIDPSEFVDMYNWAQMISAPVLATGASSPLLFGRQLWAETRIALFKQSLDTRSSKNHFRVRLPRVDFGQDWIKNSAADLFKHKVAHIPLIVVADHATDSMQEYSSGKIPKLDAVRLHNGTTYTWNRMCYGYDEVDPHLRIECRYLPAGPSVLDEIANFAFWVGLMKSLPESQKKFWQKLDFSQVKNNFSKAAKYGIDAGLVWFGEYYPVRNLILEELLPQAEIGLKSMNVNENDISKYLGVIEKRTLKHENGSKWIIRNFRTLKSKFGSGIASKEITHGLSLRQQYLDPVHEWDDLVEKEISIYFRNKKQSVDTIMLTELFTVRMDDSMELVESIMEWNNIHHLPVENYDGKLLGLVTHSNLKDWKCEENNKVICPVDDFMTKRLITLAPQDTIDQSIQLILKHNIGCVPIVVDKKLVGMITKTDLQTAGIIP